jgi:hypothetical protein
LRQAGLGAYVLGREFQALKEAWRRAKASSFEECPRDEQGRCRPSGQADRPASSSPGAGPTDPEAVGRGILAVMRERGRGDSKWVPLARLGPLLGVTPEQLHAAVNHLRRQGLARIIHALNAMPCQSGEARIESPEASSIFKLREGEPSSC